MTSNDNTTIPQRPTGQVPLDSLADHRITAALQLLSYVRHVRGPHWFTIYSTGGLAAYDLHRAGYCNIRCDYVMFGVRAVQLLPRRCRA